MNQPESPVLRTTTLAAIFAALLLPGLVWIPEPAAATHSAEWVDASVYNPGTGAGLSHQMTGAAFGNNRWIAHHENDLDDFMVQRSTDGGSTWPQEAVAQSATQTLGFNSDLLALSATSLIACYVDDTSGEIKFARSSNSGVGWTAAIDVSTASAENCAIIAFSSTFYQILYGGGDLFAVNSTNGGTSWGTPYSADSTGLSGAPGFNKHLDAIAFSATEAVVAYRAAGPIRTCYTTNAKDYTCSNTGTNGVLGSVSLAGTGGAWFLGGTSDSANVAFWCYAGGITEPVSCSNLAPLTSLTTADGKALSETHYAMALVRDTGAIDQTPVWFTETTDGGSTWSTPEAVFTLTGAAGTADATPQATATFGAVTVFYNGETPNVAFMYDASSGGSDFTLIRSATEAAPTTGPDATVSVTGLTSFDVDQQATVIIARTNSGDMVRTYEPTDPDGTLDAIGSIDTDCTINDGVFATPEAVVFIWCDTEVAEIRIRAFDTSSQPNFGCDTDDECETTIDLDGDNLCIGDEGFQDDNELRQIDHFTAIGIDYSTITREHSFDDDNRAVAWAYASSTHYIGVQQYTTQLGCDYYGTDREVFGSQEPDDICGWTTSPEDSNSTLDGTFIGGVGFSSSTKFYEYTPQFPGGVLDGTLSAGVPYTAYSTGVAIDCASDYAIIGRATTTNNVVLLNVATGEEVWKKTVTEVGNDNVAISANGDYVLYNQGDGFVAFAYRSNGTVIGLLEPPSGTNIKGVILDFPANNAWIATDTGNIGWYNLVEEFPDDVQPGCSGFNCEPGTVTPTTSTNPPGLPPLFGTNPTPVPGVGAFGNQLFFGIILVGGCAVGLFFLLHSITGAIIGSILGTVLSWGLGLFSGGVVFVIVTLGGLAAFLVFRGR